MFEYEQETYGSKGRERIRAAAMAHTGKKGKVFLPPTRRQKAEGPARQNQNAQALLFAGGW